MSIVQTNCHRGRISFFLFQYKRVNLNFGSSEISELILTITDKEPIKGRHKYSRESGSKSSITINQEETLGLYVSIVSQWLGNSSVLKFDNDSKLSKSIALKTKTSDYYKN